MSNTKTFLTSANKSIFSTPWNKPLGHKSTIYSQQSRGLVNWVHPLQLPCIPNATLFRDGDAAHHRKLIAPYQKGNWDLKFLVKSTALNSTNPNFDNTKNKFHKVKNSQSGHSLSGDPDTVIQNETSKNIDLTKNDINSIKRSLLSTVRQLYANERKPFDSLHVEQTLASKKVWIRNSYSFSYATHGSSNSDSSHIKKSKNNTGSGDDKTKNNGSKKNRLFKFDLNSFLPLGEPIKGTISSSLPLSPTEKALFFYWMLPFAGLASSVSLNTMNASRGTQQLPVYSSTKAEALGKRFPSRSVECVESMKSLSDNSNSQNQSILPLNNFNDKLTEEWMNPQNRVNAYVSNKNLKNHMTKHMVNISSRGATKIGWHVGGLESFWSKVALAENTNVVFAKEKGNRQNLSNAAKILPLMDYNHPGLMLNFGFTPRMVSEPYGVDSTSYILNLNKNTKQGLAFSEPQKLSTSRPGVQTAGQALGSTFCKKNPSKKNSKFFLKNTTSYFTIPCSSQRIPYNSRSPEGIENGLLENQSTKKLVDFVPPLRGRRVNRQKTGQKRPLLIAVQSTFCTPHSSHPVENSKNQNWDLQYNNVSNISYLKALMLIENNLKSVGLGLNLTENELMHLSLIKKIYNMSLPSAKKNQLSILKVKPFTKTTSNRGDTTTKRAFVWFNFNNSSKASLGSRSVPGDFDFALLKMTGTPFCLVPREASNSLGGLHRSFYKEQQTLGNLLNTNVPYNSQGNWEKAFFPKPLAIPTGTETGEKNNPASKAGTTGVTSLLQTKGEGVLVPTQLSNKVFFLQNLITESNQEKHHFRKDLTIAEFKHPWLNTTTPGTANTSHSLNNDNIVNKYRPFYISTASHSNALGGVVTPKLSTEVSWKFTNVSQHASVGFSHSPTKGDLGVDSDVFPKASATPTGTAVRESQKDYIFIQSGVTNNLRKFIKWVVSKSNFILKPNLVFAQKQKVYPRSLNSLEKIFRAKLSETSNQTFNNSIKKVSSLQGKRNKMAFKLKSLWSRLSSVEEVIKGASLKKLYKRASRGSTPYNFRGNWKKGIASKSGGMAGQIETLNSSQAEPKTFKNVPSTQYLKAKKLVSTMLAKDFSKFRFYSGKISSLPSGQSFFYIQNVLKQKIKRQKKHYLKKYKHKSRRTSYKRRSRAYPRPSWIRLKLYQSHFKRRWGNSGYIDTPLLPLIPLQGKGGTLPMSTTNQTTSLKQSSIWHFNRERQIFSNKKAKTFTVSPYNSQGNFVASREKNLYKSAKQGPGITLNAANFYTISQTTKSYLRKAEAESDWFRVHLKAYLARIQKYLNNARATESDWQWFGFINSLISQNNVVSSSSSILSLFGAEQTRYCDQKGLNESFSISPVSPLYNSQGNCSLRAENLGARLVPSEKRVGNRTAWQDYPTWSNIVGNNLENGWEQSLAISEYNRILYNRIQLMVLNIKQNLNSEGNIGLVHPLPELKIKVLKKQILTDIFPSSKAIKKNKTQNQLDKQFSAWFVQNFSLKPYSFWLNPISQLRPYWAYNKTKAAYFQESNGAKMSKIHRLWSNQKLRDQASDNKTKMFQKKILARWDAFFSGDLDLAKFCLGVAPRPHLKDLQKGPRGQENQSSSSQGEGGFRSMPPKGKTMNSNLKELAHKSWDFRISQKLRRKEDKLSLLTRFRLPEGMRNIISKRYSSYPILSELSSNSEASFIGVYGIRDGNQLLQFPRELEKAGNQTRPKRDHANSAIVNLNQSWPVRGANFENLHSSNSAQVGWWPILESFKNPFSLSTPQLALRVRNNQDEVKDQAALNHRQHQILSLLKDNSLNFRFLDILQFRPELEKGNANNQIGSQAECTLTKQQITVFLLSGCTLLFHFCTLISLINIPQVRCFLKFHLILILKFGPMSVQMVHSILNRFKESYSKLSNSLGQVRATLFFPFIIKDQGSRADKERFRIPDLVRLDNKSFQITGPRGLRREPNTHSDKKRSEPYHYGDGTANERARKVTAKAKIKISPQSDSLWDKCTNKPKSWLRLIGYRTRTMMSLETKINSHQKQIQAFKNFVVNYSFLVSSNTHAPSLGVELVGSVNNSRSYPGGVSLGVTKTKLSSAKLRVLKPFFKINLTSRYFETIFKRFNFILGFMWVKLLSSSKSKIKLVPVQGKGTTGQRSQQVELTTLELKDRQISPPVVEHGADTPLPGKLENLVLGSVPKEVRKTTNQQGLIRQSLLNNVFELFSTMNALVFNFFRSTGKNLADQSESGFSGTDESVLIYDLLYDLLMVCWFSDPLLLIPEQIEVQTWNHTLKLSRLTSVWPLPIKVNILFDILIESLIQPDTDLIIRQQKGTVFFEIWGDFLIKAAEEYKMHIPSISQYPDEQALLVDKFLSTGFSMPLRGSVTTPFRHTLPFTGKATQLHKELEKAEREAIGFAKTQRYTWNNKLLSHISFCYENLFPTYGQSSSPTDHATFFRDGAWGPSQNQLTSQSKVSSWSVDQFLTYQSQDTNMLIDVHPPKSFAHVGAFKYYSKNHQCIGNLVCEIYSGTFTKKVSKNVLVVGHRNSPNFLIQALAGETELKIITDNSRAYATQQGIKQLKNVFEAIGVHSPCIFLLEDIHLIGERRPFAMSDEENSGDFDELVSSGGVLNSPLRMHEKNQVFYEVFRHSITHYQKPFRGDSSLLIPTNHFSVDLFLGVSPPRSRQGIKWENALIPPVNLEDFGLSQTGRHPVRDGDQVDSSHAFGDQAGQKFVRLSSSLQVPSDQFFAPPATSPLSVLVLKEQYKLKPRKIVNDSPFADRETVQLTAKINYSIRFKVTRLAELASSKRLGKFEMVTDLLMILDTVRSQRGFIVFATTNAPSILDPAIRRPGRLDETIYLPTIPNLWSRWQILKSSLSIYAKPTMGCFFGFPLGLTIDYLANSKIPLQSRYQMELRSQREGAERIPFVPVGVGQNQTAKDATSPLPNSNLHIKEPPSYKNQRFLEKYTVPALGNLGNRKITSKNVINIKAITYFNVSKKLISTNYSYNPTSYDGILWTGVTHQIGLGSTGRIGNNSSFLDSVQNLLSGRSNTHVEEEKLREQEIFLSFYSPTKMLKQQLIQLFAGKVGESLAFSGGHGIGNPTQSEVVVGSKFSVTSTGNKREKLSTEPNSSNFSGSVKNARIFTPLTESYEGIQHFGSSTLGKSQGTPYNSQGNWEKGKPNPFKDRANRVVDAPQLLSTYGIDTSWRSATSLVFALIQKRYLHTKNKILVKLLNFIDGSNSASPSELPSHDRLFAVFAPAKRYENYKRTERDFQVKQSYQILEKIQMHQQHRLTRRLYDLPVQKFFRSEMIENSLTTFSNVSRVLGPLQKASVFLEGLKGSPHKTTSIHWYYKKRVLMRHRHYLTNQWLNAQYPEHNVETVFLSDIDWRYNFIESLETGSITDILLDFPDADQYYNPKHRRWMCTSGSWTYNVPSAFASEQILDQQIYAHFIFDSFLKAYKLIDNNREILDYLAFKFMKLGYLKEINLVTSKSKFSVL